MIIEVIDLLECLKEQAEKQLENHYGIEADVFMNREMSL